MVYQRKGLDLRAPRFYSCSVALDKPLDATVIPLTFSYRKDTTWGSWAGEKNDILGKRHLSGRQGYTTITLSRTNLSQGSSCEGLEVNMQILQIQGSHHFRTTEDLKPCSCRGVFFSRPLDGMVVFSLKMNGRSVSKIPGHQVCSWC